MSGSTSLEAPPASPVDIGIMLEKIRCKHEEIERLEKMVMEVLKAEETSQMNRLWQGHCLQRLVKSIIHKSEKLVETYEKIGGDIAPLRFQSPWTDVSSAFSSRLQEILDCYKTHTSAPLVDYEALSMEEPLPAIGFTEEECYGRYLDLHDLHNQYINSPFGERIDYSAYLDVFSQPEKISSELKTTRQYTEYMEALLSYLIRLFQRTQPLQDPDRILSKAEADLEEQYGDRQLGGLEKQGQEKELIPSQHALTDLVEELTKDLEPEKLNERPRFGRKQLQMEARVKKLCNLLYETIERTKQKEEKNQALAFEGDTESESGDGYKSAPERSIGWDGKPIPYWLDKLGLGQEYKCEICRGESYAGKRAFERHFKEERHLSGLVCFGLSGRAHSQITDPGTEWKDPDQAPAGVAIPPRVIRNTLELIVGSLLREGLETQRMIIDYYRDLAGFEFLKSSDVHHEFYKHRLAEQRAHAPKLGSPVDVDGLEGLPNAEKLNGVASIEEAREILLMGMPKRERPLGAEGKSEPQPRHTRSRITDLGTQGKDANQAPAGVAIPPPGIRKVVEHIVGSLLGKGLETERRIIDHYSDVAGFEFLKSSDVHHAFYKHRLAEQRAHAHAADSQGAGATSYRHDDGLDGLRILPAEFKATPQPPKRHKFTCRRIEGLTGKELDIIKLTAQFWALYDRCFWEDCRERRKKDPQFEFMKPTGGQTERSYLFAELHGAYYEIVNRPGILKEDLRKNAADVETVLERCFNLLQWDRYLDELVKAKREKAREAKSAPLPIAASTVTSSS